jgi:hypothetical protein
MRFDFGNGSGKHEVDVITIAPDWVLLFRLSVKSAD